MPVDIKFGTIEFVRNSRNTRLSVRIFPSGLRISLPSLYSEADGLMFIELNEKKILAKQQKLRNNAQRFVIDEFHPLETLTFKVVVSPYEKENLHISLSNKILTIKYPKEKDCTSKIMQKHFWNGINYFLRKEAKRLLPERTKQLASMHGFFYYNIKIQSSKTRWGSCSQNKSINLSFYLLLLPSHLIDYIILHELCHTKEMNHSPRFWSWLEKVTDGQNQQLKAELKTYHIPR